MSRFQAQTNAVLDQELEELRKRLGLTPSQKADLLREVASLAAWIVRQAEAGRSVEARRGAEVETLTHPVIERLRARHETAVVPRVTLTDAEAERLARILDRGFEPTPALRAALQRLASPKRRPPKLRWKKTV
ncbi:hypothetical protein [Archangium sp.]|jgi:hypothetical protein|uniref:hypothetical protein n=1 Tax=Archangium sp. TaxID=1872627 RepID=UPI002ED78477